MDITSYVEQQKQLLKQEKMRLLSEAIPRSGDCRVDDLEKSIVVTPESCPAAKFFQNNSDTSLDGVEGDEDTRKPSVQRSTYEDLEREKGSTPEFSPAEKLTQTKLRRQNEVLSKSNDMEQWVTDTFFLNFPSLNQKSEDKKNELRNRQARDYQEYLSNLPPFSTKRKFEPQQLYHADEVHTKSDTADIYVHDDTRPNDVNSPLFKRAIDVNLNQPEIRKDSPRHRQLENLKHVDLPAIIHTNKVEKVNRQHAQDEVQKKMDYQQDLIKQIEEKRREVEHLREKEKREEELLTRRLEQQLKTMELEEELEKEKKRSEKIRLANEQNHIRRMQLLSKLENDHKLYNPYDENRKSLSENGKDAYLPPKDTDTHANKVYRYFSNSAKYDHKLKRYGYGEFGYDFDRGNQSDDEFGGIISAEPLANYGHQDRYQYCKRCRHDITDSFLRPKREPNSDYCLNCHLRIHHLDGLCTECSHKLEQLPLHCQNCNSRLQTRANTSTTMNLKQIKESANENLLENPSFRILDVQYNRRQEDMQQDSDNSDHNVSTYRQTAYRNQKKINYSYNVDKNSIFNPHKKIVEPKLKVNIRNGEIYVDRETQATGDEEGKRKTEDRIARYAKNYDDLRTNRKRFEPKGKIAEAPTPVQKYWVRQQPLAVADSSSPKILPKVKYPRIYTVTENSESSNTEVNTNSRSGNIRKLASRWDVPAVKKTTISDNVSVLTQLGAIKKQLQLEQLKME